MQALIRAQALDPVRVGAGAVFGRSGLIEIKGLAFGYSRVPLFSRLDLSLGAGNIYGLLGKNGAGKTTLLKLICGLRYPEAGACRVLDMDPRKRPVGLLREIFLLTEEFVVPPIPARGYEAVYAPFYPRFDRAVFRSSLQEFEIDAGAKLTALSYGQKKKVLLAFGMAAGCGIVLLDEPTNGLDIPSKSQFRRLLARTVRDDQIILISTHQVRDMENLIDPIIVLDQGRIIFQQPMSEVTRRLASGLEAEEPRGDEVLFSEKTFGGWIVVRPRGGREETRMDLEVLFNTVIANREKVAGIFASGEARDG
jgi:ABC-2 type transport system ATP-binding protein